MNESKVMTCLNQVLINAIMKASSLTIQNNLNKTLSLGLKKDFVLSEINAQNACIMSPGGR